MTWFKNYNSSMFVGDCVAGLVTASIALPQSLAYAQLAGFPPEYGLYAAILPLLIYACLGSSRTLVVGPAALISLLIGSSITKLAPQTTQEYINLGANLTILTGLFLSLLSLLRLGSLTTFISKPVISGFTSASAIIIASSQIPIILGLQPNSGLSFKDALLFTGVHLDQTNLAVMALSILGMILLWSSQSLLPALLKKLKLTGPVALALSKSSPVLLIIISIFLVDQFHMQDNYNIAVIGQIPDSLPTINLNILNINRWPELAFPAASIALICFLTSIATGVTLASKRREKLNSNQELLALGAANIGSSLIGSFALAGSVSRSMVNYASGAVTQAANLISAAVLVISLLFVTPYLINLPKAVLGVIVITSVLPMIDFKHIRRCWVFNKADAISLLFTFLSSLFFGVEIGIWAGIACSMVLFIHRTTHPHIAEVGRAEGGYFRNVNRLNVKTQKHTVYLRIDENLFFANVQYIENYIIDRCKQSPEVKHLVLLFSSVNSIDESALETLEALILNLREANITLHLSDVKGIIQDKLKLTDILQILPPGKLFFTADQAMNHLENLNE
ncbi:sulfate permease [Alteromonas sp. 5E99-2]|uniref:SulP family inorganic anion transporter n=1 Tax=Alteromonas sp. 5E99-2 TaxID=2817683 RepID=UPI001A9900C4|nr:sulfate permease [Alteromonas sp. 5E99-2]MBO1256898.1 sulfate permease [Alteromonas sp. 5E99-2]